jgi:hypothetical protein
MMELANPITNAGIESTMEVDVWTFFGSSLSEPSPLSLPNCKSCVLSTPGTKTKRVGGRGFLVGAGLWLLLVSVGSSVGLWGDCVGLFSSALGEKVGSDISMDAPEDSTKFVEGAWLAARASSCEVGW